MGDLESHIDSAVGKWAVWYENLTEPRPYGRTETYELGAGWLKSCALVEDWGCGKGFLRTVVPAERYRGIDGTDSPFCDEVVDLCDYRSTVPGIFMRHVLEHNERWPEILDNAIASFTERMALVVFTPQATSTHQIGYCEPIGVPDIAFNDDDLTSRFGCVWKMSEHQTQTYYKRERIFFLDKT